MVMHDTVELGTRYKIIEHCIEHCKPKLLYCGDGDDEAFFVKIYIFFYKKWKKDSKIGFRSNIILQTTNSTNASNNAIII